MTPYGLRSAARQRAMGTLGLAALHIVLGACSGNLTTPADHADDGGVSQPPAEAGPEGGGDSGAAGDAQTDAPPVEDPPAVCPAELKAPEVSGCDGVSLTNSAAVESQSDGIATTDGPAGSTAVRIEDGQFIDVADEPCLQLGKDGGDFSVSMWLKLSSGTSQILGTTSQYSRAQGFLLSSRSRDDGDMELHVTSFGERFNAPSIKSVPFEPGTWVHVVLRYDGRAEGSTASIDVNLRTRAGSAAPNVYNDKLRIGDEGFGTIAPFEISEARSYGRLLSDAEVKALFLDKPGVTNVSVDEATTAVERLQRHLAEQDPLSDAELLTEVQRLVTSIAMVDTDAELLRRVLDLVNAYETTHGAVFTTDATRNGVPRDGADDGLQLARAMLAIQQAIVDQVFNAANVTGCRELLDGRRFLTADYFPGAAPPPADASKAHDVTVDATLPAYWGRPVAFAADPERRPTGLYVSPGGVARVVVPEAMVDAGFRVLVGAHTADHSNKQTMKRMDRVSTSFPITDRVTYVANPLGGGVYIVVPYLANLGPVTVSVSGVIEAPFFSLKASDTTTEEQWRQRRTAPGPWADFETEKFMMQVPSSWIHAYDDPASVLRQWDEAMDGVSELMGYPPEKRNRVVLYQQVDVQIRHGAFGIGYPQVNNTYNPHSQEHGNKDHWLLTDATGFEVDYHELGHAQLFSKFRGETEAAVNFLHAYVRHVKFGVDFDTAFKQSFGPSYGDVGFSPDDAAIHWMVSENFRAGQEMDHSNSTKNQFRYQHRGYAKYADLYRLFGWQALRDFYRQEHLDYMNDVPEDGLDPVDSRILRLSLAAEADLTPLIHFWGIHPVDASTLAQRMEQMGVAPSQAVRDHIERYKAIAPANNTEFNEHFERVYPGRPTEGHPDYGVGWYNAWRDQFDETHAAQIQTRIDEVLELYYP